MRLSDDRARLLRVRAQRLGSRRPHPAGGVAAVVKAVCGVQAQLTSAAALSVRARCDGLVADDVAAARLRDRAVVRTWALRGTLHLVAADDLGWLRSVLAPALVARSSRRWAQLRLDEDAFATGIRVIRAALGVDGPLTRGELVERLAARGVDASGQRAPHLLFRAALDGVVCHGPERAGEPTYVLLDDWVPRGPALPPEAAHAELARRYLAAYAPAEPRDLGAWSGLPMRDARAAWSLVADELVQVTVRGRAAWLPADRTAWLREPPDESPVVRLLPHFDTYLLGYHDRELAVAPEHARRVNRGGGWQHPTVSVDGRVVATWRLARRRGRWSDADVEPFGVLDAHVRDAISAESADVARFLQAA